MKLLMLPFGHEVRIHDLAEIKKGGLCKVFRNAGIL